VCILVALLGGAVTAPAEDAEQSSESLHGLNGVHLAIAAVSPELESRGITTDVVFSEVVLRLRQAAVPLLDELPKPPPHGPELHVEVLANVDPNFDQCSFGFRLELRQVARLERDPKRPPLRVVTWSTGGIGEAGAHWRTVLREELGYYVDRFVTAYRDANPL
jgi:broad specificity phosphatase PhoE